jgi:hypothetical protein
MDLLISHHLAIPVHEYDEQAMKHVITGCPLFFQAVFRKSKREGFGMHGLLHNYASLLRKGKDGRDNSHDAEWCLITIWDTLLKAYPHEVSIGTLQCIQSSLAHIISTLSLQPDPSNKEFLDSLVEGQITLQALTRAGTRTEEYPHLMEQCLHSLASGVKQMATGEELEALSKEAGHDIFENHFAAMLLLQRYILR